MRTAPCRPPSSCKSRASNVQKLTTDWNLTAASPKERPVTPSPRSLLARLDRLERAQFEAEVSVCDGEVLVERVLGVRPQRLGHGVLRQALVPASLSGSVGVR